MADLPVAEGGRPGGGGGPPWLMIGAVAGIGTLLILLMKSSGGAQGTTAAGTSINAALGSIQEQNLNLMGQVGAGVAQLSTQATDYHNSELAALSGMQDAITNQINGVDQHLTDVNGSLSSQLSDVNNNVIANGQSITALGTSLTAYYNSLMQQGQSSQQAMTNTWQTYYNNLLKAISASSAQTATGTAATQQMLASIGSFLNWQFYQIPNRYAAYIPGQEPGGFAQGATNVIPTQWFGDPSQWMTQVPLGQINS